MKHVPPVVEMEVLAVEILINLAYAFLVSVENFAKKVSFKLFIYKFMFLLKRNYIQIQTSMNVTLIHVKTMEHVTMVSMVTVARARMAFLVNNVKSDQLNLTPAIRTRVKIMDFA